ncbi:MAG: hypothetical protein ABIE92_08205 [bacterium]
MNDILAFVKMHGGFILSLIVAVIWYFRSYKGKPRSLLGFSLYPIYHIKDVLHPKTNPFVFVIVFSYLIFLSGISYFIFPKSPYVYLVGSGVFLLFQFCLILIYTLQPRKLLSYGLIFIIPGILITVCIFLCIKFRSYQPINILNFIAQVTLFVGAIIALLEIFRKDLFPERTEMFFIAFGLIIYSFLHMLSTSIMILDYVRHYDFSYYSTLITLIYWIAIIPWIKRLKFKLSSV